MIKTLSRLENIPRIGDTVYLPNYSDVPMIVAQVHEYYKPYQRVTCHWLTNDGVFQEATFDLRQLRG